MSRLIGVKQFGLPAWPSSDIDDLLAAAQDLRDALIDGTGACHLYAVDGAHMQSLPQAAGWHLRSSDGITETKGFCFATGAASQGNVVSTVLLPLSLARALVECRRSGRELVWESPEVRYAHFVAAHEQGHSVDYHYRFTGQQTSPANLGNGPVRLEPLWRAMTSKLISELCANGYAASTISAQTYQERAAEQNQTLAAYWNELEKDFRENSGPANAEGRTVATAAYVLRAMLSQVHAVSGHIANSALPKPVLWSPPRRNLAEARGFTTNWLRQVWEARRSAQAADFEAKVFEGARLFAKKLGFELKLARRDEQSDWLLGPAGGF